LHDKCDEPEKVVTYSISEHWVGADPGLTAVSIQVA